MKKGLFLSGYSCESWIWEDVTNKINSECNVRIIDWPIIKSSNFHCLSDFANWVNTEILPADVNYDFVVGHSMGGLVALYLAKLNPNKIKKIILIESFITSPSNFFKNLMMKETSQELLLKVSTMLKEQRRFYSDQLSYQLIDLDLTKLIKELKCNVYAIYGDRGVSDSGKVISELNWPSDIKFKVKLNIIHNSCHFPMLENSQELSSILNGIL